MRPITVSSQHGLFTRGYHTTRKSAPITESPASLLFVCFGAPGPPVQLLMYSYRLQLPVKCAMNRTAQRDDRSCTRNFQIPIPVMKPTPTSKHSRCRRNTPTLAAPRPDPRTLSPLHILPSYYRLQQLTRTCVERPAGLTHNSIIAHLKVHVTPVATLSVCIAKDWGKRRVSTLATPQNPHTPSSLWLTSTRACACIHGTAPPFLNTAVSYLLAKIDHFLANKLQGAPRGCLRTSRTFYVVPKTCVLQK